MKTAYWSAENFEHELAAELKRAKVKIARQFGRLFVTDEAPVEVFWAQNIWRSPEEIKITSINDGAKKLRERGTAWAYAPSEHHRRAELIQEQLKELRGTTKQKPVAPYSPLPHLRPSAWTMIEPNVILASRDCSAPVANGEVEFIEAGEPPSRAYAKLWEFFTLEQTKPKPSDLCLDLGSCPGGWTWVLSELGARVISVDKAPLDDKVLARANVEYLKKDAFQLKPQDIADQYGANIDWLCSDVICEPKRLCELVETWVASGLVRNFVCSVKFKGETDWVSIARLLKISGSTVRHLNANKHEFTWSLLSRN